MTGKKPLIGLGNEPFPSLDGVLKVVEYQEGIEYVTFAHCWVDSLSSDTETGLPACQISTLQKLTKTIRKGTII
jgi:hypothetical protein